MPWLDLLRQPHWLLNIFQQLVLASEFRLTDTTQGKVRRCLSASILSGHHFHFPVLGGKTHGAFIQSRHLNLSECQLNIKKDNNDASIAVSRCS